MNADLLTQWQTKKSVNSLEKGEVHVWRAFLNWSSHELQQAVTLLSPAEKKRAQRFIFDEHRFRFIASHAILRYILSYYIDRPLAEFDFYQNDHGKPYLQNPPPSLHLQF